jgi:hypothetical protein
MAKKNEDSVPSPMKQVYESITRLTDDFCQARLGEEYAKLCRVMAATLSRKRPSPLSHGRIEIWACAIVYAVGRINFLFDKAVTPHMKPDELCGAFDVKQSTVSGKAGKILDMLDAIVLDPRWTLPSKLDSNPMAWYIQVDGIIIDARSAPLEVQEEAYRLGLIPYIPAARPQES